MRRNEKLERAAIVSAARGWLGTKFHDCAAVKGVGVDCAQFLAAVFTEAGLIPATEIAPYSPQWMLHRDEPLFEDYVRRLGGREIPAPGQGDIVLYRVGRSFAHGAIVIEWPRAIIHAYKTYGFVAETGGDEADLGGRARKFFTLW